ncbi:hypothetical protein QQF64_015371 [Cirrhinus molitorella]|uniref:Uncharacterized protein n=1 Tax=Cirrhinus molitorella TaxID=172907 RepID=A0ABR3NVI9_9TELE
MRRGRVGAAPERIPSRTGQMVPSQLEEPRGPGSECHWALAASKGFKGVAGASGVAAVLIEEETDGRLGVIAKALVSISVWALALFMCVSGGTFQLKPNAPKQRFNVTRAGSGFPWMCRAALRCLVYGHLEINPGCAANSFYQYPNDFICGVESSARSPCAGQDRACADKTR